MGTPKLTGSPGVTIRPVSISHLESDSTSNLVLISELLPFETDNVKELLQEMLIWWAWFLGGSLLLLVLVRWTLRRFRAQRTERLRQLDLRFREAAGVLDFPPNWLNLQPGERHLGIDRLRRLRMTVPFIILGGGICGEFFERPWGNGLAILLSGFGAICVIVVISAWIGLLYQTTLPPQIRQLASVVRWWAIRVSAGIAPRRALSLSASQLKTANPEMAEKLRKASEVSSREELRHVFEFAGDRVAATMSEFLFQTEIDALAAMRSLADQLEQSFQSQLIQRTRLIENALKYPILLCLTLALNLVVFGPIIVQLYETVHRFRHTL